MIEFPVNGYGVWCVVLMRYEEFKEEMKERIDSDLLLPRII